MRIRMMSAFAARFAFSLVNGIATASSTGNEQTLESLLIQLRRLRKQFPQDPRVGEATCQGILNSLVYYQRTAQVDQFDELVPDMLEIKSRWPELIEKQLLSIPR